MSGQGVEWVIGVGASAGGVDALRRMVRELPLDLPAAVCIVLHIPANGPSLLAAILDRETPLPVSPAVDGEPLEAGRVYVAPPDRHLTVEAGHVRLAAGAKENGVRPAVDPLLRSLAAGYGARAIAVVLSGALHDGAAGAARIKAAGGTIVVQDPQDAPVPGMPQATLDAAEPDWVVPAAGLGELLVRLVGGGEPGGRGAEEVPSASSVLDPVGDERRDGRISGFRCPECSGPLWEASEGELSRYRCRVGHAFSEEMLVDQQGAAVEAALRTALEVLEERAELLRKIADRLGANAPGAARRLHDGARQELDRAELLRRALGDAPAVAAGETLIG